MHRRIPPLNLLIVALAGCASPVRERDAAAREFERFRADAARARYWSLQAAQKPAPPARRVEWLSLTLPERTEDGVIRLPTVEHIPLAP